jgi:hypothetical protein
MASIILRRFSACCLLARGEVDFADFGDAFDDVGDLLAEFLANVDDGDGSVFDRVVEQAGGDGDRVHLHLGQYQARLPADAPGRAHPRRGNWPSWFFRE